MCRVMIHCGWGSYRCEFEGTRAECEDWVRLCRPMKYRITPGE